MTNAQIKKLLQSIPQAAGTRRPVTSDERAILAKIIAGLGYRMARV